MAKYSMYKEDAQQSPAKKAVHPVWRGIGCILMILIPILSYTAADMLVRNSAQYKWVILPKELLLPNFRDPLILEKVLYTAIFVAILYLVLTVITFFANRFFGPPRYGPYDVPPDQVERK